jgi:cytochrome oxidase Cu insertion factor (SCO1/SenC/PrrC family)
MAEQAQATARRGTDARAKRTIALLALIAIAPVVAAYAAYYLFPPDARVNYGALIAKPAPPITGERFDGGRFDLAELRGRWVVLIAAGARCDAACERMLYATRQARTMQGREMDRVVRAVLLTGGDAPRQDLLEQHPGLVVARSDARSLAALPVASGAIYLVDPLGNLVLRYADDPDIKRLAKDLERILKASSIG